MKPYFLNIQNKSRAIVLIPNMNQVTIVFIVLMQVTFLYCAPINLMPQIQQSIQWPQLQQPFLQMPQELQQPLVQLPLMQQLPGQQFQWSPSHQPSMQMQQMTHRPQFVPVQQEMLEAEQLALQQQMMALQEWQVLQKLITMHSPVPMPVPAPLLVIIPNPQDLTKEEQITKATKQNENELKHETDDTNDDSDSVIIEKDSDNEEVRSPAKAILLLPKSRFGIGSIIATIPWLPIEVNVPDTIAWGYNGISNWISGIISIIGQRFPLRRPQTTVDFVVKPTEEMASQSTNVKTLLEQSQRKEEPMMPILVVPMGGALSPFQIIN